MAKDKNPNVTPMMAQFLEIKERYPDSLLFYRMGDFYELFFDDAKAASAALDIALTKRGKHLEQDIPMCGVPVHAAEGYLLSLIRNGFRVAVCEQMESPAEAKKRGAKSVVKRDVVRLVTPGTLTEDTLLHARSNNFLAAWSDVRGEAGMAWCDISTGEFQVTPATPINFGPLLARIAPSELLIGGEAGPEVQETANDLVVPICEISRASFDSASAERSIKSLFGIKEIEAFGNFTRAELGAIGAIIDYLEITQRGKLPLLRPPVRELSGSSVSIDAATRRNLELTSALSGGRAGSLLATVDRTVTGSGARLLEARLTSPSTDTGLINDRLEAVTAFCDATDLCEAARTILRKTPDTQRALSRISLDRGGPRDMAALRTALTEASKLHHALANLSKGTVLAAAHNHLTGHEDLSAMLMEAIAEEPPLLLRDGGFVAAGYDEALDEARGLRDDGRSVIAGLQSDYSALCGVTALKIKHNNVLGYFIETPATHAAKMLADPLSETFIHRQTTANAVRFTTVELSNLETRIINAGQQALEIEKRIFGELRQKIMAEAASLSELSRALAEIDLAAGLAELAQAAQWTRPIVDGSKAFDIEQGRHPVVEAALHQEGQTQFVPNDCNLSETATEGSRLWLLTGPNMAGKSTFLRQNALIAILAQMGSYVPAVRAHIGVVDQVFSRVGAADDLARGRSTFMVEMVETAAILNQAGPRALVILDEIGRGTATYDGLSIAWATLENLHDTNRCRALFATHYHELTTLSNRLEHMKNATVAVREWEGDVIFMHEVKAGAADRSYGVQVARLAGLPEPVVNRARVVLDALEKGEQDGVRKADVLIDDLPLFSVAAPAAAPVVNGPSAVEERLADVLPDALTPREALELIYELKALK